MKLTLCKQQIDDATTHAQEKRKRKWWTKVHYEYELLRGWWAVCSVQLEQWYKNLLRCNRLRIIKLTISLECFLPTHWYSIYICISITYFVFSLIYEFTLQQLCNSTQSELETEGLMQFISTLFNHRNATAMSHLNFLKHSWVANYDLPQSTMGTTVTLHNRRDLFFSYVSCPLPYSTEWKAGISNGREHNTCIYYPEALNNDPKLH